MSGTPIKNLQDMNLIQQYQNGFGREEHINSPNPFTTAYYNNEHIHSLPPTQINTNQSTSAVDSEKDIAQYLSTDDIDNYDEDHPEGYIQSIVNSIPVIFREPLVIVLIFIILSQPIVKKTIGCYITQINPDADGVVGIYGVIIYGIILSTLFVVAKKFILE